MQLIQTDQRLPLGTKRLHLFETPMLHGQLVEAASLNAELAAAIAAEREHDKGIQRSNLNGWHSNTDMLKWGGDAAKRLAKTAIEQAQSISHFEGRNRGTVQWSARMWANVSPPGALNMSHVHTSVLWAAVYYVDMGTDPDDKEGGELLLEDPRYPMAYMTVPGFRAIGANGRPQNSELRVRTKAGDLLIFPGYLRHRVSPHRGSRDRISIAMNISAR